MGVVSLCVCVCVGTRWGSFHLVWTRVCVWSRVKWAATTPWKCTDGDEIHSLGCQREHSFGCEAKPRPGRHEKRRPSALRNHSPARSFRHRNFRHDLAIRTVNMYVQMHSDSRFQIKNSVAFTFPRVTFVSSPNTEVVVHCPAVFFAPPLSLGEKLSPPYAARIPSMGKCFHNALTSCTVGAHTSCNSHTLSGYRYFAVKSAVG